MYVHGCMCMGMCVCVCVHVCVCVYMPASHTHTHIRARILSLDLLAVVGSYDIEVETPGSVCEKKDKKARCNERCDEHAFFKAKGTFAFLLHLPFLRMHALGRRRLRRRKGFEVAESMHPCDAMGTLPCLFWRGPKASGR